MVRKLIIAAVVSGYTVMLAGCSGATSTADLTKIDQTIGSQDVQTGIQFACIALQGAEAGWTAWTAGHTISTDNLKNAQAAIAGAAALCTPPYPQNTADAVSKVISATVVVVTALKAETTIAAAN